MPTPTRPIDAAPLAFGGAATATDAHSSPTARRRSRRAAVLLASALLLFGNGISALPASIHDDYAWWLLLLQLALAGCVVWWVRARHRLTWADIGLQPLHPARDAGAGILAGAILILPVVIYFIVPVGMEDGAVDYGHARESSLDSFLAFALIRQPLGTSFFEETMFRGVLQSLGIRAHGLRAGVVFVALVFALWHVVVNVATLSDTNAATSATTMAAGVVASMAVLVIGSIAMSILRLRTGSLVAPIAFHWAVVVLMQGTLVMAG